MRFLCDELLWQEAFKLLVPLCTRAKIFFLLFFFFVNAESENAQRKTIRGRSSAINLDSFLICKTSSCSMYVPPPPMNHPMSPIIQFREASDHNKINLSLFSQIGADKFHPSSTFWWIFVSISFNHTKALFDAFEPIRRSESQKAKTFRIARFLSQKLSG